MLLTNGNGQLLLTALFFDSCSLDYWSFLWQETYGVVSNHYLSLGPISLLNSILRQEVDTSKMRWMFWQGHSNESRLIILLLFTKKLNKNKSFLILFCYIFLGYILILPPTFIWVCCHNGFSRFNLCWFSVRTEKS